MTIFIYATRLNVFTSGMPMRGLFLETARKRKDDEFIFYFNESDKEVKHLIDFIKGLEKLNNAKLIFENFSQRWKNIKALIGMKNYLGINIKADLYISPGTIDFFGERNLPLINILTDLSQIRTPESTSVPWHGKYILKNLLKHTVKYSSKTVCISDYTKNDLIKLYPQIKDKTTTVHNGIEPSWFDEKYAEVEIDGLTNSKTGYWIWYGYISKRKNILNLLKAYSKLLKEAESGSLPKILLIGKVAPNQEIIRNYIYENLKEHVIIVQHIEIYKLKYLLKNSKGLLFPSYYEGFGLPVIEAFSQGRPVLHSNVSSLPEIAGGLGISCDPYSIESIKQGLIEMNKLVNSEEVIKKRIDRASKFTYKNAALEFSKIIDEVMSGKK